MRAITRFRSGDQYLKCERKYGLIFQESGGILDDVRMDTHLVTLKTLRSLSALRPDRPNDPARGLKLTQNTSKIDPVMTAQSKRLKAEPKYTTGPRA